MTNCQTETTLGAPRIPMAIIGLGGIGMQHARELSQSLHFDIVRICDRVADRLAQGRMMFPAATPCDDVADVWADSRLQAVGIFTLADARPALIRQALARGLHVLAEKPLGPDEAADRALLPEIETSGRIVAVNLFNRNAWYHGRAKEFVQRGQIGKLAAIRACHIFPGPLPEKGYVRPDGPPFRDCGMHYVDIVRWHAGSDYADWSARGLRVWGEDATAPWWVSVHGSFNNNVLFEITNSYAYAVAAKERCNCSTFDLVGTHGVIHIEYDAWGDVQFHAHGIDETVHIRKPYNNKNFDVLYERFAHAIATGEYGALATARDAVEAAATAERMNHSAVAAGPHALGTWEDLDNVKQIRKNRKPTQE